METSSSNTSVNGQLVAEAQLEKVDYTRYMSPDYDKLVLFKRALTVFHLNYFGERFDAATAGISCDPNAKNIDIRRDFVTLMAAIFEQKNNGGKKVEDWFSEIENDVKDKEWTVTVSVEECRATDRRMNDPSLIIHNNLDNIHRELQMKGRKNLFYSRPLRFTIKMNKIREIIQSNKEILVEFRFQSEYRQEETFPKKLAIKYFDIFPVGYRQWFSFDQKVECLISIQFSLKDFISNPRKSVQEHTQMLWHMFRYRYKQHMRTNPQVDPPFEHKPMPADDMVGELDLDTVLRNVIHMSATGHLTDICPDIVVKDDEAVDVSIGSTFCNCTNEWCNIRTFFYQNGWLGLVVQRFVQFFVNPDFNLAPSYVLALSHLLNYYSDQRFPTYLLNLLGSALRYMKIFYSINLRFPSIDLCSYKLIRDIDMDKLTQLNKTTVEPFDPSQVNALLNYCQLFDYLHSHIARMDEIVPTRFIDNWFDTLYERTYKSYNLFMMANAEKGFTGKFGKSFELFQLFDQQKYNNKFWVQDSDNEPISNEKNEMFSKMGVTFNCHPHIIIIYRISKFIADAYDDLPDADKQNNRCNFSVKLDEFLSNAMLRDVMDEHLVSLNQAPANIIKEHKARIQRLLVMKLFSMAFTIQRYITYPMTVYRSCAFTPPLLIVDLKFTFATDWIERVHADFFDSSQELFIKPGVLENLQSSIIQFYAKEWPFNTNSELDSVSYEHFLLISNIVIWWKLPETFPAKVHFKELIDRHTALVINITNRSVAIFEEDFNSKKSPPKMYNNVAYDSLIRDQAAIYIVQAACFSLARVANSTARTLYKLYMECESDAVLYISRPGTLELIATVNITLKQLVMIRTYFSKFDDHCNTIARAIENTRQLISSIYKDFYWRIFSDWYGQMDAILCKLPKTFNKAEPVPWTLFYLSVTLGIHYVVYFDKPFRRDFLYFRKKLLSIEKRFAAGKVDMKLYNKRKTQILNLEENSGSTKFNLPDLESEIFSALRVDARKLDPAAYIRALKV